jgi:hypothetical protein
MKRGFSVLALLVLTVGVLSTQSAHCDEGEEPLQLAIFNPVQLRSEDTGILGLRLNLIYGKNVSVKGLDLGLINHSTGGSSVGIQHGLVGYVEGDFLGWQDNAVSIVKGRFQGFQTGIYNEFDSGEGFQLGWVNKTRDMSGLQVGIVNFTESMYGLQVGLVNVIQRKERMPVMVLVNWSF